MMGLEKLLRGLYGSVPQLDMDNQFARVRVPQPVNLDFKALAEGIKRNNVGTAAIEFEAVCELREGKIVLQPTGQTFPLAGPTPAERTTARRRMKVTNWAEPEKTAVEILR